MRGIIDRVPYANFRLTMLLSREAVPTYIRQAVFFQYPRVVTSSGSETHCCAKRLSQGVAHRATKAQSLDANVPSLRRRVVCRNLWKPSVAKSRAIHSALNDDVGWAKYVAAAATRCVFATPSVAVTLASMVQPAPLHLSARVPPFEWKTKLQARCPSTLRGSGKTC